MAYIEEDKLLKDQDPSQAQGAQGGQAFVSGGQTAQLGGPQSGVVGNGTSTAGIGSGGTGGWTNVQAYMNANKSDTGSSQLLQDKIGSQFENEKTQMKSESEKLKGEGQKAADGVKQAYSSVGDWIDKAGKEYNYGGAQSQSYNDTLKNVQNTMNGQYTGPTSYAYSFSNPTQQYGQALGNGDAFNQFMGDIYNQKGGGKLSTGGRALQTQLDVSNEPLAKTRENLLSQYSGLGSFRDQTTQDTTNALSDYEKQFRTNQNSFKDYLGNTASTLDSTIAKQESDAKAAYQNDYLNGRSGRSTAGYAFYENPEGATNQAISGAGKQDRIGAGIYGNDLTWDQLQREQDLYKDLNPASRFYNDFVGNRDSLNSWSTQQDAKYADTADTEERKWNAIQDFLGNTTAERKKQGFKVR